MVPALGHRRVLVAASVAAYVALVFVGLARVEVPGLGLGNFLYVPVALLALATGPAWGTFAGAVAAGTYVLGAWLNPHFVVESNLLPVSSAIRLLVFCGLGWLIGSAARSNRELLVRLKEHAERDFLTDLVNTRAFETALADRLERGRPFALLLADVNELKRVNDEEGHAAGNEYLRRLAAALREETSPEDTVARVGGDEFAVLTEIGADDAEAICRGLQAALRERGLSASFGYSAHPLDGADRLTLFRSADRRLYGTKLAGADRHLRSVS